MFQLNVDFYNFTTIHYFPPLFTWMFLQTRLDQVDPGAPPAGGLRYYNKLRALMYL